MLEEYEHAKARGAPILAELIGYGMTADAADMVNPSIEGASIAMQMALDDAGLVAVRHRLCQRAWHGDDRQRLNETRAIKQRVRQRREQALDLLDEVDARPLPWAPAAASRRSPRSRPSRRISCPPTVGLDEPDPECDLDYTPNVGRDARGQLRDVELLRLWRPQRGAGVRPASGLSRLDCFPRHCWKNLVASAAGAANAPAASMPPR